MEPLGQQVFAVSADSRGVDNFDEKIEEFFGSRVEFLLLGDILVQELLPFLLAPAQRPAEAEPGEAGACRKKKQYKK